MPKLAFAEFAAATLVCVVLGCGANTRSLPVASAIIVHACGAAEADAYIRGGLRDPGSAYAVSEFTVSVQASGEANGSVSQVVGVEAMRGAEKSAEAKVTRLPTLKQCLSWGYLPQLGIDGCIPGAVLPNGATCVALPKLDVTKAPPEVVPAKEPPAKE